MALLYPDILQHNNSTKALVDITEIRGNSYPINLLSDTGSIPADKRKIGAIVFVSSSQNFYGFYGQTTGSWDTATNWRSLGGTIDTGSLVTTSSFNAFTSSYSTGSFTGSFIGTHTGSLFGTSSWATNALTASYVLQAVSASYSSTASYAAVAGNGGVTQISAGPNINISPTNGLGNVTITSFGTNLYNTATGSYGSFYDTGSVSATSATRIYSMSLSNTDISNGVFVSSSNGDTTKIKFTNAGVYNVQFSAQFSNSDNTTQDAVVWVRKNGTDIVDSSGTVGVPSQKAGAPGQFIASWNYYLDLSANDYVQLCWHVEQANVITLETIAAGTSPTHPRTPSVIVTAQRVDTFLSNTGSFSGSFTGTFSGSLFGTSSWATNAINSNTASYVLQAVSSSFAQTASFAQSGNGSFSGSFSGSGANLNSIPTIAVVGNFTQIATGSVTASVTPTQFSVVSGSMTKFVVTGTGATIGSAITDSHRITGSLTITGSNTVIGNKTITGSLLVSSSNATQFLVGSSSLFVSSSGFIGIGTTTPSATLDVNGSVNISGSGVTTPFKVVTVGTGTGNGSLFVTQSGLVYMINSSSAAQNLIVRENSTNPTVIRLENLGNQAGNIAFNQTTYTPINNAKANQLQITGPAGGVSIAAVTSATTASTIDFVVGGFASAAAGTLAGRFTNSGRFLLNTPTDDGVNQLQVSGSARVMNGLTVTSSLVVNGTSTLTNGQTTVQGSSAVTGNALVVSNSTPTTILTIQNNGQVISNTPTVILAASQSAFLISQSISQSAVVGATVYGLNLTPTFYPTTASQTQTALRVAPTFTTGSVNAISGSNIIADFGSLGTGTQFTVNDITSGSIYMVNDVSGLPIIEANSNWDVNIYDYPTKVFQKTGSQVIINGTLKATGSFILPLSQSTSPQLGSAYWSGSLLFVHNGTRYMSASFF